MQLHELPSFVLAPILFRDMTLDPLLRKLLLWGDSRIYLHQHEGHILELCNRQTFKIRVDRLVTRFRPAIIMVPQSNTSIFSYPRHV